MDLHWGVFGENLTIECLLEENVRIGDRLRVGSAEFIVTQPRMPCFKLGIRFGRPDILKRFLRSSRTGFYFAVLVEGEVGTGDSIELMVQAEGGVSVADVVNLYTVPKVSAPFLLQNPYFFFQQFQHPVLVDKHVRNLHVESRSGLDSL